MPNEAERGDAQRHADRLVGQRVRAVRYVDIDYWREDRANGIEGPRVIDDEAEWLDPTWSNDTFDSVDYGVEIETTAGRVFTVTWGPPGDREGLDLFETAAIGHACVHDAAVAVWDVTRRGRWHPYLHRDITEVSLRYQSDQGGFWCPRITIRFGASAVELVLAGADNEGTMRPAGNNVAVVFDPRDLPAWADGE